MVFFLWNQTLKELFAADVRVSLHANAHFFNLNLWVGNILIPPQTFTLISVFLLKFLNLTVYSELVVLLLVLCEFSIDLGNSIFDLASYLLEGEEVPLLPIDGNDESIS